MPDLKIYLTEDELAFVKRHKRGFVRDLVKWSLRREREKREAEIASQPVIEERHERFMEEA